MNNKKRKMKISSENSKSIGKKGKFLVQFAEKTLAVIPFSTSFASFWFITDVVVIEVD